MVTDEDGTTQFNPLEQILVFSEVEGGVPFNELISGMDGLFTYLGREVTSRPVTTDKQLFEDIKSWSEDPRNPGANRRVVVVAPIVYEAGKGGHKEGLDLYHRLSACDAVSFVLVGDEVPDIVSERVQEALTDDNESGKMPRLMSATKYADVGNVLLSNEVFGSSKDGPAEDDEGEETMVDGTDGKSKVGDKKEEAVGTSNKDGARDVIPQEILDALQKTRTTRYALVGVAATVAALGGLWLVNRVTSNATYNNVSDVLAEKADEDIARTLGNFTLPDSMDACLGEKYALDKANHAKRVDVAALTRHAQVLQEYATLFGSAMDDSLAGRLCGAKVSALEARLDVARQYVKACGSPKKSSDAEEAVFAPLDTVRQRMYVALQQKIDETNVKIGELTASLETARTDAGKLNDRLTTEDAEAREREQKITELTQSVNGLTEQLAQYRRQQETAPAVVQQPAPVAPANVHAGHGNNANQHYVRERCLSPGIIPPGGSDRCYQPGSSGHGHR